LSFGSLEVPEWIYTKSPGSGIESIRWGLYQRCERVWVQDPSGSVYSEYRCRDFPSQKDGDCQHEVDNFCILWHTAGYSSQLSLVFAAAALVALMFISSGFGTHARRRTAWQGITFLVGLHGALQIIAMAIIVNLHRRSRWPVFKHAKLSSSFYLSTSSWVFDVCIIGGLLYTAFAAKSGKRWAVGRTGYRSIPG